MAKKHNYSFDIDQLMQKRIIMAKEIAQLQVQNWKFLLYIPINAINAKTHNNDSKA